MDSLPGETEDSRTSEVGRKRDLTAFALAGKPSSDHSDDLPESSPKRMRQDLEKGHSGSISEVIVNTSAPLQIDTTSSAGPHFASTDQPISAAPQPITWNRGVQSGLRTSFGSRVPSLTKASTIVQDVREVDTTMSGSETPPEIDVSQPALEGGDSSLGSHGVVEIESPAKTGPKHMQSTMPKGRNVKKKKPQASDFEPIGVRVAEGHLRRSSVAQAATDDRFPRLIPPEIKRVYENGRGEFVLDEILQDNKHIKLEDLNAEAFAHHFLVTNSQKLDGLTAKHIKAAFNKYLTLYYKHLPKEDLEKARNAGSSHPSRIHFGKALTQAKKDVQDGNKALGKSTIGLIADPESLGPLRVKNREGPNNVDIGASSISQLPLAATRHKPSSKDDIHSSAPQSFLDSGREEEEMSSDALDGALSDMEIELLQKYFPTVAGSVTRPRCLACAGSTHKTFDCPALTCNICDRNHLVFTCPQNIRCLKCRAKGHHTSECPEKLSCAPSEAGRCDLCGSKDHLENACHLIWRSYSPRPQEIKSVRKIPVSCYVCGASNHYGPECGLHNGRILSGGVTWSKANLHRYLDPSSSDRAIAAGTDFSLPPATKKSFSIKGQATDPIMLDDSDDDAEFIRPSVKPTSSKSQPPGTNQHIRFAQNRNFDAEPSYRAPKPARQARPHDSAWYNRERSFSPPPRYDDFRAGFNENDRYIPQGPARGDYRSSNRRGRPGPADNSFRGGPSERGRGPTPTRGGGNGGRGKKRGKKLK